MLRLAEIWIHPVKSLAGARVPHARLDDRGLAGDRRFMIVDAADRMVTQRQEAHMAKIAAQIEGDVLVLGVAGAEITIALEHDGPPREVSVWDDRVRAIDAGDDAASFLSDALGRPVRLVRMPASTHRSVDPRYARAGELVSFADGFPFLLVTDGSLAALNERLETEVDVRRFRPNFVVAGAEPFAEEGWRELAIGPVRFSVAKPCARCAIVNVDPDRAVRGLEPLAALAGLTKRDGQVYFGQNLLAVGQGEVVEGDGVVVVA